MDRAEQAEPSRDAVANKTRQNCTVVRRNTVNDPARVAEMVADE